MTPIEVTALLSAVDLRLDSVIQTLYQTGIGRLQRQVQDDCAHRILFDVLSLMSEECQAAVVNEIVRAAKEFEVVSSKQVCLR